MPSARKTARSGDPRKRAAAKVQPEPPQSVPDPPTDPNSKYAPTAWGSNTGLIEDLEVPSGQLCQVRRPGIEGLVAAGILHDVDFLTQVVNSKHIRRVQGKQEIDAQSMMQDPASLNKALHLINRVVCYVVIQPKIHMIPNDVTLRKPELVYTDMVDEKDKMFIFNYAVGGTRDAERFLRETGAAVGDVDDGEDVEDATVSSDGNQG